MLEHEELARALVPVVQAAGKVEIGYYNSGVQVLSKADDSPVTAADRDAEAVILEGLGRIAPDIPVVAEEAVSCGMLPEVGERFFLVDPLDGTREFIAGRGEFTVNVALVVGGRPVFGIVYAPALSRIYLTLGPDRAAEAVLDPLGRAAALSDLELHDIHVRRADMAALSVVASRSHLDTETEELLGRYSVAERVSAGSSLKFCLVASGKADLYPRHGRTMEWDTAAGHAVLDAAGGVVLTMTGEPLVYAKAAAAFANPGFIAAGQRETVRPAIVS